MFRRFAVILLLILALSPVVRAEDDEQAAMVYASNYATPSWPSMVRTMVRFNALNLGDLNMVDEFSIITECDLYKAYYRNDFKWNQVRQAVRDSAQAHVATYPMSYHYDTKVQLDRYDFQRNLYRFTERSVIRNVNAFLLYAVEGTGCGLYDVKYIPRKFRAVLSTPIFMDGLPLSEKDAQSMFRRMESFGNTDHVIFVRFNLRIVYIDPLRRSARRVAQENVTVYEQSNNPSTDVLRMDARLDSIDFFEDPKMTRMVYQFTMQ